MVELGNPVDHLSCVAREYGIAMLTGVENGVERLREHEWVVVDACRGNVSKPLEKDIADARALAGTRVEFEEMPEIPTDPAAADLYKNIVPLNLTDAYGPTFSIAECRTLHDLVRYVHEKAIIAMFEVGDSTLENSTGTVRHLESDVPFD